MPNTKNYGIMAASIWQKISEQATPSKHGLSRFPSARDSVSVLVKFTELLPISQIVEKIKQANQPQVILWYIGCYGLSEAGVHFYRDNLIKPIITQNSNATLWLTDLTAWFAFKDPKGSIQKTHSCAPILERCHPSIRCISAAQIFSKMQKITDSKSIQYLKKALKRDFILKTSRQFPDRNIRVRDIFPNSCPLVTDLNEYDTSKAYSIFQYLEGCLLIEEIFQASSIKDNKEAHIIFVLPSNETRYYKDDAQSFQKDVKFLISEKLKKINITNAILKIEFISFPYSENPEHKPYNAPGKKMSLKNLTHQDITGISTQTEPLLGP